MPGYVCTSSLRCPRAAAGGGGPTTRDEHRSAKSLCQTGSTGFLGFPGRRHQSIGPETSHLFGTVRHHSSRLTLSFSAGSTARGAHDGIGPAHPHAHKRILFKPWISHSRFSETVVEGAC